jgi:protein-disulfide isomerase
MTFAVAAECAARQSRFREFHRTVFEEQSKIPAQPTGYFAERAGIPDTAAFTSCVAQAPDSLLIASHVSQVKSIGAAGTPAVLVAGGILSRFPTIEELDSIARSNGGR